MHKKTIFIISIFLSCMMMILFSCCETQKDEPKKTPSSEGISNPQTPEITTVSDTISEYKVGDTAAAIEIEANVTDNGQLSYAWSKSDSKEGAFTPIGSATSSTYVPDTSEIGTAYYKCTVTNTLNGKTASAESEVFTVKITDKDDTDNGDDGEDNENKEVEKPSITNEQKEYEIEVNKALTLTVMVSMGGGSDNNLSYKWEKSLDNEPFTDLSETTESLTIANEEVGTFYYRCTVTNSAERNGTTKTAASHIVFTVKVKSTGIEIDFTQGGTNEK